MAQEIIVKLIDDLDGSDAVETVKFAYDGVHYEIDLNATNKGRLDKALQPFVTAARRTGGRQIPGSKKTQKSKAARIREWAAGEGLEVPRTGVIPKAVVEAYDKAQQAA